MSTATHGGKRGKKEGTEILDKLRIVMVTVFVWRATHRLIAVLPNLHQEGAGEGGERERESKAARRQVRARGGGRAASETRSKSAHCDTRAEGPGPRNTPPRTPVWFAAWSRAGNRGR